MKNCLMRFVDVYTQVVKREEPLTEENCEGLLNDMINSAKLVESGQPAYIMDSEMKIYHSIYVSHKIINEDNRKVYSIFFKLKLLEIQPMIKK